MNLDNLENLHTRAPSGQPLLGLDLGTRTIGVAVSDPDWRVASPMETITRTTFARDIDRLGFLIRERNAGGIIIGLPLGLDGADTPRTQGVRDWTRALMRTETLPRDLAIAFWDERFSTAAVERFLIQEDTSRKRRGAIIDKLAACYILQGALDRLVY